MTVLRISAVVLRQTSFRVQTGLLLELKFSVVNGGAEEAG